MPPSSTTIRPADPSDFDALCQLWEALDEHHRRARPGMFRAPVGERRTLASVEDLIQGPDSAILVAEGPNGRLDGLVVLMARTPLELPIRISQPFAEIDNIVVAPSARRRRVGAQLVAAAKTWARSRDLARLELTAYAFNGGALDFYRAACFEPVSHRLALTL